MKHGDLSGKVAIITGAAQGIGFATAQLFCDCGCTAVIADLNLEKAEAAAAELNAAGGSAIALLVNVIDPASIQALVERVVARFGRIDILVNNAGIVDSTPIPELSLEGWDKVIDIDLRGTHLCSQAVLPQMKQQNSGRIINLASQAGQLGGWKAGVNYSSAKGGVLAMTKAYARHCAPWQITVNAVAPGFITTEMTAGRGDSADEVPLRRLGTALDVAKAIYFLACDLSDYITGFTVDVNGGYFMH